MRLTALPAADRLAMPWKNGGGITREVAVSAQAPDDDFDWRVSIAQVDRGGPFSIFVGVERVLIIMKGALRLSVDGQAPIVLDPASSPFAFDGEALCVAQVIEPVVDLNIMTRRGAAASVRRATGPSALTAGRTHLWVATQPSRLGDLVLEPLDAVRIDEVEGQSLSVEGEGWLIGLPAGAQRPL